MISIEIFWRELLTLSENNPDSLLEFNINPIDKMKEFL